MLKGGKDLMSKGIAFLMLVAVVMLYLVSVGVLYLLSLIGPISATINGVIQHGGNSIWFAAGGVVAAFLLIAALALFAFYQLLKLIVPEAINIVRQTATNLAHLF